MNTTSLRAAGADEVITIKRYAHLVGSANPALTIMAVAARAADHLAAGAADGRLRR